MTSISQGPLEGMCSYAINAPSGDHAGVKDRSSVPATLWGVSAGSSTLMV
ncbi:MAG TPA: hypothetical protein VF032_01765 [Thermoleophilaceae bacterium]